MILIIILFLLTIYVSLLLRIHSFNHQLASYLYYSGSYVRNCGIFVIHLVTNMDINVSITSSNYIHMLLYNLLDICIIRYNNTNIIVIAVTI